MADFLMFIILVTIGYLSGSVCSAVIVSKIFALPDPRSEGSQNPGATNVLRLAGKKYAIIVLVADMLKGMIPVILAHLFHSGITIAAFTCLAAVLGHMFPIFFHFKGGKGVATALGALLALHFMLGVLVIATWLLVANYSRYSSLASIVAITLTPIYSIISLDTLDAFPPLLFMAMFILYKHRDNINRLIDGDEPKISFGKKDLSDITDEILYRDEDKEETPDEQPSDSKKSDETSIK